MNFYVESNFEVEKFKSFTLRKTYGKTDLMNDVDFLSFLDYILQLSKNIVRFFYVSGMFLSGFGEVSEAFLGDSWGGFWDMFGRVFKWI